MQTGAGSLAEKTNHDLEWERLAAAVVSRCRGPRGKRIELPLASTREGTALGLEETEEAMRLLSDGEPLPVEGIRDVREHLARVDRMGALDGPALRDVMLTLGAARVLRRFLSARKLVAPALVRACSLDPTLDGLETELADHLDADGTLADHASPELRRLRTETANLRARLVGRLEEIIHKRGELLSDRFFTIREGRYVLPVRADTHERVSGIVHGTSSSGATVFVEPDEIIVHGNRLKMAQAEQEREEARILGVLTESVRERLSELVAAVDSLDHADLRAAMARFGKDLGARILPLAEEPVVDLRRARHPLLLLEGVSVVPNDLPLARGHALVLSGPNAGGKTVALKTLGLSALMMRAGLPIPADEGSSCGFFDLVLSDVGDDQSLVKNLSTFSAHITNIAAILRAAGDRSLVLLDELAGGTDPEEGAALACALVDSLCRKGAAVAVTTHYEPLKAMATRDPRLRNAAVGFDVAKMEPTFTLALDAPGASSALMVAQRFGIPASIVEFARKVLPEQSRTFDELVRRLEEQRKALAFETATAEEERRKAEALRRESEERLASVAERERGKLSRENEKLLEQIRRSRDELKVVRRNLRDAKSEADLEAARKSVEAIVRTAQEAREATAAKAAQAVEPGAGPTELAVGDRVYVTRLRTEADILEGPSRGKVRVAAGPLKLWVELSDVRAVGKPGSEAAPERLPPEGPRAAPIQTADNTCDVRGMRVDDAVAMVEAFLDRMFGSSQSHAYVVHGVGSGALRDAVRELLARSGSYVKSHRPGTPEEGGPRLTVVEMR